MRADIRRKGKVEMATKFVKRMKKSIRGGRNSLEKSLERNKVAVNKG